MKLELFQYFHSRLLREKILARWRSEAATSLPSVVLSPSVNAMGFSFNNFIPDFYAAATIPFFPLFPLTTEIQNTSRKCQKDFAIGA